MTNAKNFKFYDYILHLLHTVHLLPLPKKGLQIQIIRNTKPQFLTCRKWEEKKRRKKIKRLFKTQLKLSNTLFQTPNTAVEHGDQEGKQKTSTWTLFKIMAQPEINKHPETEKHCLVKYSFWGRSHQSSWLWITCQNLHVKEIYGTCITYSGAPKDKEEVG